MKAILIARLALVLPLLGGLPSVSSAETRASDATQTARPFPTSALGKLPYLYFSENNLGESCIFRMRQEEGMIEVDGRRHIGFQFWSTGLVEWLFITTPGDLKPGDWFLVNDRGEQVGGIQRTEIPLEDCPRVVSRYPQASRVTRYKTEGEELETRGRYHLLQRTGDGRSAPYAISLTSSSPGSYEAGRSGELIKNISEPLLRLSSDVVIENMKAMRHTQGMEAAADYLAREMEQRIDDEENKSSLPPAHRSEVGWSYIALYVNAWYEAQTGGGRLDANWAAAVYDAMYDVCLKRGYFARADVAINLTKSLSLAGRYGRLTEVFEIWKEGMRLGGYRMDTTSYADLGAAFPILPQVRKRDIPYLTPYANAKNQGIKVMDRPSGLGENFVGSFENHAIQLWFQGHWHESLEWLVWTNAWATDPEHGGPRRGRGHRWHISLSEIADMLSSLGFMEQALALHENALQQENDGGYEGVSNVRHQMRCLTLKMRMGRALPENGIDQARDLIKRAAGNLYEKKEYVQSYEADLGELLIHAGRTSDGEALLDELAAAGSRSARIARVKHWVKVGRAAGVEAELLSLLNQSREGGRKMEEIAFYRIYADFLEQQGRLNEALRIRREIVRLCQSFDLFTHLPVEMARLAALLNKMGILDESQLIANQARELPGKGQIPDHMVRETRAILDGIGGGDRIAAGNDPDMCVDFQPLRSVVMPLKGASWVSHLTLANPSGTTLSGTLRSTGLPVRFREVGADVDILATLGGQENAEELSVLIEPASYKIIALHAADDFTGHGKLSLSWTPDNGDGRTGSHILLEEAISGATTAIIQAGAYKLNPFYGIPVYHHYHDTEQSEHSRPMRFVSSETARIEIYGMDGTPIAIDGQGNGSLRDAGDELFGRGDGLGNLHLPLTKGGTSFMILIYPQRELPDVGLGLRIECREGDQWELYAEDRLMPAGETQDGKTQDARE